MTLVGTPLQKTITEVLAGLWVRRSSGTGTRENSSGEYPHKGTTILLPDLALSEVPVKTGG